MAQPSKHFLVAVLDWGLGHATRSVPVINQLLELGHRVSLAGNGNSLRFLKREFPELPFFELVPYGITYPTSGSLRFHLIRQIPRLLKILRAEHEQVEHLVLNQNIDIIISDQRYGCYSKQVPDVIISHQVNIQTGWWSGLVNFMNHRMIKRFDQCWIPDDPVLNLSGILSQTHLPVRLIGALSRFKKSGLPPDNNLILGVISGPELQRTQFEGLLTRQFETWPGRAIIVRGLIEGPSKTHPTIKFINHLDASELSNLIEEAGMVITRSGYSTLLDLARIGKKNVVLVPTPGQTEQEYLAQKLDQDGIALSVQQHTFDLKGVVQSLPRFRGFEPVESHPDLLTNAIQELIDAES